MATSEDLIDFEVIDAHKENIQALPSGRSAKALAQIYSPPLFTSNAEPVTEAQMKARAAFERELLTIDEADDPLDIYDRYVRWTLDTFPSAQATSQSQLLPLLERATKAFQNASQYKNDSRYLKLWLHYINLFSDAPREAFVFLSRSDIGEALALYYEEYAAWLELAGRWTQAEEIYNMGLEKRARPVERLSRKYNEFKQRKEAHTFDLAEPTSPALPIARPALAAKHDPFSAGASPPVQQSTTAASKKPKSGKMQIFADLDAPARPDSAGSAKGWESIGTLAERKKENNVVPRPMAGEKLKVGKTNGGMQKMMVFRDNYTQGRHSRHPSTTRQCAVNQNNGKLECVYVNLEAIYPQGSKIEYCFEELRARNRQWRAQPTEAAQPAHQSAPQASIRSEEKTKPVKSKESAFKIFEDSAVPVQELAKQVLPSKSELAPSLLDDDSENRPPGDTERVLAKKIRREERANRTRKIQVMDVKHIQNETKTIQLNLESPQGTKAIKKKKPTREQTMTINTKEAMEEIYDIFSQPLATDATQEPEAESDDSDECTTDADSTATGKMSARNSEYGDETRCELYGSHHAEPVADVGDLTGWSDDFNRNRTEYDMTTAASLPALLDELTTDDPGYTSATGELISIEEEYVQETVESHQVPLLDENSFQGRTYARNGTMPNHRLPFMTPIAELTESSIGTLTVNKQRELLSAKTPSRQTGPSSIALQTDDVLSSPFQEVTDELLEVKKRVLQPIRTKSTKGTLSLGLGTAHAQHEARVASYTQAVDFDGPIIQDAQCNPMDPALRDVILEVTASAWRLHTGLDDRQDVESGKSAEIKRWTKAVAKASRTSAVADKTVSAHTPEPVIAFENSSNAYHFKRELGAGTFAPVFLVEVEQDSEEQQSQSAKSLRAIKMEDPPSIWEWVMINKSRQRLGASRALDSIINVDDMHLYKDECFLIEQYCDQGTLLDMVNLCRTDNTSGAGMDETLAMWCAIELFRTVEALHANHIIHGDLKGDNIMVRFDDPGLETDWPATYFPSGSHGWSSKGITLIDFGRAVDMDQFVPNVGFVADWKTTEADCAEMREMRPWTYQIDYHGLAGTLHSMLFGKYMEVVVEKGAGLGRGVGKIYRIHDSFKRYWQVDIWSEVFDMLLNPLRHAHAEQDSKMPLLNGMRSCREKMESWLEDNCEKGIGLKGMISKLEGSIKEKKKRRRS